MTAHIVVSAVDDRLPVTLSKKAIDYLIRGLINFNGLLISDAIDMKALNGSVGEKAAAVIAAGCDLVAIAAAKAKTWRCWRKTVRRLPTARLNGCRRYMKSLPGRTKR